MARSCGNEEGKRDMLRLLRTMRVEVALLLSRCCYHAVSVTLPL